MKRKSIILILAMLIPATFVSCGMAESNKNKEIINKESVEEGDIKKKFNELSDEKLLEFVQEAVKYYKDLYNNVDKVEVGSKGDKSITQNGLRFYPMKAPYETKEKMTKAMEKYFAKDTIKESYIEKDGITYITYSEGKNLDYKKIENKAIKDNVLTVAFSTEIKDNDKLVKETKYLDFIFEDNELKLKDIPFSNELQKFYIENEKDITKGLELINGYIKKYGYGEEALTFDGTDQLTYKSLPDTLKNTDLYEYVGSSLGSPMQVYYNPKTEDVVYINQGRYFILSDNNRLIDGNKEYEDNQKKEEANKNTTNEKKDKENNTNTNNKEKDNNTTKEEKENDKKKQYSAEEAERKLKNTILNKKKVKEAQKAGVVMKFDRFTHAGLAQQYKDYYIFEVRALIDGANYAGGDVDLIFVHKENLTMYTNPDTNLLLK